MSTFLTWVAFTAAGVVLALPALILLAILLCLIVMVSAWTWTHILRLVDFYLDCRKLKLAARARRMW